MLLNISFYVVFTGISISCPKLCALIQSLELRCVCASAIRLARIIRACGRHHSIIDHGLVNDRNHHKDYDQDESNPDNSASYRNKPSQLESEPGFFNGNRSPLSFI